MSANRRERRLAAKQAKKNRATVTSSFQFPEVEAAISGAVQFRDSGQFDKALDLCERVLPLEPDNKGVHFVTATVHEGLRNWEQAITCYRRAIELDGKFVAALCNCATCHGELKQYPEALALLRQAKQIDRKLTVIDKLMGDVFMATKRYSQAIDPYRRALAEKPSAAGINLLAAAYDEAGQPAKAIEFYKKAIGLGVPRAVVMTYIAKIEQVRGNFEAARTCLEEALKADPDYPHAHMMLASSVPDEALDDRISLARDALERLTAGRHEAGYEAPLHFCLFQLLDRKSAYDAAFRHLIAGNELMSGQGEGKAEEEALLVEQLKATYTAGFLAGNTFHADDTFAPVFVFGMPRSGTTLVEQIVSSHPKARGVGEIEALYWAERQLASPSNDLIADVAQNYMEAVGFQAGTGGGRHREVRIVDKSLSSHLFVGLISLMFPRARFICCNRHPLVAGASMYAQMFEPGSVPFTCSQEGIARQQVLFDDIMRHWKDVLPGRILSVRYEALVDDPEANIRMILEHLSLEWDEACLAFHDSGNTVRSASVEQVRQPIYKSAWKRWRHYADHFEPLRNALDTQISAYERSSDA